MNALRAVVHEGRPPRFLNSLEELNRLLLEAAAEAKAAGLLNVISLYGCNDDHLSLVVGGDETVMGFIHGHGNPPYYASVGAINSADPVLTAYVSLNHHTEFLRRWVIPMQSGELAARQFLATDRRPESIRWMEV